MKIKPIERPEPTAALDLHALVGRRGAQATLMFHGRKAGVMLDRRTRRLRTRAACAPAPPATSKRSATTSVSA